MLEVFVEGAGSGVLELEGEGPGIGDLFDELFLGDVGELGELDAFGADGVDAHAHEVLDELQRAAGLHVADVGGLAHLLEQAFLILVVGGLVAAAEQGAGAVRGKGGTLAHGDDEVLLAQLGGFGFEHHHRFDVQGGQVEMHAAFGEVFKHAVGSEQNALGVFGHGHTGDAHVNLGGQFLHGGGGRGTHVHELLHVGGVDVVHHHVDAVLDDVGTDAGTHLAEADKTNFHGKLLVNYMVPQQLRRHFPHP